jgi:adenosine deaminase
MFVDLHRHIEGSISAFVTSKIGEPLDCRWSGQGDFFSIWGPVIEYMSTPIRYGQVVRYALEELSARGTKYVEFQFSPAETFVNPFDTALAIRSAFDDARRNFGIYAGLIYTVTRHLPDTIERDCSVALELYKRGLVCGVGLAGDEVKCPIRSLAVLMKSVIDAPIPKTFHAGEFGGPREIEDAIALGATRIGHANHLVEDSALLNVVRSKRIGIEVCITSELQLKNVESWEAHPIRTFLEQGVLLNLNTDDPAIFGTEIDLEYKIAKALVSKELLLRNAVEMAFASADVKERLLASLN